MGIDFIELTAKKKPCSVEAVQFFNDPDLILAIKTWMNVDPIALKYDNGKSFLKIPTLEGTHIASEGDYIVRGVNGECYPCKPEIFWKTYEVEKTTYYHYEDDESSSKDVHAQ